MANSWTEKRAPELTIGDVVIGEGLILAVETLPDEMVIANYSSGEQRGYAADDLLLLESV